MQDVKKAKKIIPGDNQALQVQSTNNCRRGHFCFQAHTSGEARGRVY